MAIRVFDFDKDCGHWSDPRGSALDQAFSTVADVHVPASIPPDRDDLDLFGFARFRYRDRSMRHPEPGVGQASRDGGTMNFNDRRQESCACSSVALGRTLHHGHHKKMNRKDNMTMKKGIMKRIRTALIILVASIFVATAVGSALAGTFQIKPKGDKKIKIGVLDLISSIEVAALANNFYKKWAAERGWDLQVFDLNADTSKAQAFMDNMITAGYDGIIVNWTDFKYFDQQVLKAYKAGIPVQGIACGNNVPGVISQGIAPEMGLAALSSLYLVSKLHEGDKVIAYHNPLVETSLFRFNTAKVAFDSYRIKYVEMNAPASGDPYQNSYDGIKNALLADTKKEIKGIWTHWEGFGVSAARAAMDMGRKDIIVVTCDDAPNTYTALRELPTLWATSGANWDAPNWTLRLFKVFDQVFAGKPVKDQEIWFSMPNLVTKDNLPPPGYYYNPCGYEGRKPDFEVK